MILWDNSLKSSSEELFSQKCSHLHLNVLKSESLGGRWATIGGHFKKRKCFIKENHSFE
jgi:hypothetical protein